MEVWSSHTPPHPARRNKGIFMVAKKQRRKDSSGTNGKLLYFKAVCLCSIPGPRITNNVIQRNKSLYISQLQHSLFYKAERLLLKVPKLVLQTCHCVSCQKRVISSGQLNSCFPLDGINLWALLMKTFYALVPKFDQDLGVIKAEIQIHLKLSGSEFSWARYMAQNFKSSYG